MTEERPAPETDEPAEATTAPGQPEAAEAEASEAPAGSEAKAEPTPEPEAPPESEPEPEPLAQDEAPSAPEPTLVEEDEGDVVEQAAKTRPRVPDGPRGRRVLAALFWLLASVMVLFGGVVVWAHQTLLTSDGWGGIVEDVISEEEVTEAISVVIVDRLADSTLVRDTVAEAIPGPDIIAGAVTAVVQDRVTDVVADFAQTDAFQTAFVNVNKTAHDAAMTAIRGGDGDALTSEEGVLTLNIFPLIEGVLYSLQDAGFIDEGREIPDLTSFEASDRAIALIEQLLDRDIPDGVGTIVLIDSENLELIHTTVRWFDLITGPGTAVVGAVHGPGAVAREEADPDDAVAQRWCHRGPADRTRGDAPAPRGGDATSAGAGGAGGGQRHHRCGCGLAVVVDLRPHPGGAHRGCRGGRLRAS